MRRRWIDLAGIAGVLVMAAVVALGGCSDGDPLEIPLATIPNSVDNPRTPKAVKSPISPGAGGGGGGANCAGVTCANFATQAAAQAFFVANGCSGLDGDSDGIACEALP